MLSNIIPQMHSKILVIRSLIIYPFLVKSMSMDLFHSDFNNVKYNRYFAIFTVRKIVQILIIPIS